uniref:ATP synthase F0 subunit 8 n=1 Tax=Aradus compar TaxID=1176475 RepID=A0A172DYV2_9HEMI|nr:ATP synthase F0 subunit 8 [Aradus compar]AFI54698.1 ATP synthase F0 subunit 8 [Aradus compar]
MPQMAPLWWSALFMVFAVSYIMSAILLFYLGDTAKKDTPVLNKNNVNSTWKW